MKGNGQPITIEFRILPQTPNGKRTQTLKTEWSKTAQAEGQEYSLLPCYPKQNAQNRKRAKNDNYYKKQKSTVLEESVIYLCCVRESMHANEHAVHILYVRACKW